ncbi:MAG: fibronectin type III domain-containing protein [Microthrixaceae bacterium]
MSLRRTLLLATCCVTVASVLAPASQSGAATSPDWGLGVFRGSGRPDLVAEYETWLGRPVTYALDFVGQVADSSTDPWASIDDPSWWCTSWASSTPQLVLSAAMLPNASFSLAQGARGDFDSHWRLFAKTLVAKGCADTIVRLGWEFNGLYYPWAAGGKEASYAAYWRRIVTTMRGVTGQRFEFDWAPLAGNTNANVEAAYPGDAYVDVIGLDAYDTSTISTANPTARWNDQVTRPYGLQWQDTFARAHGKPMSLPEWGLTVRDADGLGGGDNPAYITHMWDWISRHDYIYANYFEVDAVDADHRLMTAQFANGGAEYRRLVRASSPSTVAAEPGSSSVLLTWTRPSLDNGAPPAGYVVTPYVGNVAQTPRVFADAFTSHNITRLTPGVAYTFTVAATNAIGTGPPSQRTSPVVVGAPTASRNVTASPGSTSALVKWAAPVTDNGSAITGYVVTPYVRGIAQTPRVFTDTATAHNVTRLTPGVAYVFTVAARNAIGTGPPSQRTSPVVVGSPTAPRNVTASARLDSASVTWTAPTTTNGSPITGYVVTPIVGYFMLPAQTFGAASTTRTIVGLTSGLTYRFTVAAVNANGTGPSSLASNPIVAL